MVEPFEEEKRQFKFRGESADFGHVREIEAQKIRLSLPL
jgi:hypothetical protein